MADNSRNQHSRDRQIERNEESERGRRDTRQNTSANEMENEERLDRGSERKDRVSTSVPDNYERDSE
jgi:hypothetical protein